MRPMPNHAGQGSTSPQIAIPSTLENTMPDYDNAAATSVLPWP
jgi:hypothetical protein